MTLTHRQPKRNKICLSRGRVNAEQQRRWQNDDLGSLSTPVSAGRSQLVLVGHPGLAFGLARGLRFPPARSLSLSRGSVLSCSWGAGGQLQQERTDRGCLGISLASQVCSMAARGLPLWCAEPQIQFSYRHQLRKGHPAAQG